ncbi:hypothetical protein HYFRA_00014074 [Hymenoscyphus fraxineus]|uniref:Carrier domain-containing protein n=1 Tax=Hymenoscyphus fraxineus TaxID=746836 RepID=A0A9N9LDE8_9HELO|nr:hypothetical protein HYFRA_00014074 [Hymenoscyphus fraxineus]
MLAAFFLAKDGPKFHGSSSGLVGFSESTEIALHELRGALSQSLPEYEVPSLYIPLDELPLTASGKLDRASLRAIAKRLTDSEIQHFSLTIQSEDGSSQEEPLAPMEKILRSLWSRALGIEETMIGPHSSFFKLGADSVSALRLSSLARKGEFILTVANILRSEGSLRLMATFLVAAKGADADSKRPAPFTLLNGTINPAEAVSEVASNCTLLPAQILDIFPCTPLQEAMMALSMAQPGAYVAQYVFRLPTASVDSFRKSWEKLHQYNEILRTRIAVLGKTAYQVVVNESPTWATSSTLDEYLSHDKTVSMEYDQPLNRTGIVEQNGENFFIWTAHHSIYDGYSLSLLLKEFDRLFKGLAPCVAPSMASLTRFLSTLDKNAMDEFWKAELEDATPSSFPSTFNGERRATQIVQHQISTPKYGFSNHTTTTHLRAAWAFVAAQYSNSNEDIVYGVTLNGRNASVPGIGELQGPTIATIPFRVRFSSKAQTITSLLDDIQQKSITLFEHSGYEHIGLQNIKKLDSHTDHACDFQSLLVVQNQSREDMVANEAGLQLVEYRELGFDSYSLVLECFLEERGINIRAVYDPNVFPEAQAVSLMFQIHHVYDQLLAEEPQHTVSDIEVFSPHDRTTLRKWNEEEPEVVDRVIHEVIYQHAQQTPDSAAVHSWDGNLTFRELEQVSDALALRLANLGVGSTQKYVPLCFEKSLWAIVSKIAVMKTGAAFVPLSSGLPLLRLQNICKQISPNDNMLPVMLVSPKNADLCSKLATSVIALDSTSFANLNYVSTPFVPISVVTPNHTAYVIFTSGSTGTPKVPIIFSYCHVLRLFK